MLARAIRLRHALHAWFNIYDNVTTQALALSSEEWDQLRYIISLIKPFAMWTEIYSFSSTCTIHTAWGVYESLFNHLEDEGKKLRHKKLLWKYALLLAIDAATTTLTKYYSRTSGLGGVIYNLGTVLSPEYKLSLYEGKNWGQEFKDEYQQ